MYARVVPVELIRSTTKQPFLFLQTTIFSVHHLHVYPLRFYYKSDSATNTQSEVPDAGTTETSTMNVVETTQQSLENITAKGLAFLYHFLMILSSSPYACCARSCYSRHQQKTHEYFKRQSLPTSLLIFPNALPFNTHLHTLSCNKALHTLIHLHFFNYCYIATQTALQNDTICIFSYYALFKSLIMSSDFVV